MNKYACTLAVVLVLSFHGVAGTQDFPIMDQIATKVIQKYQQSTCEQLWMQKSEPKTEMENRMLNLLRSDPQMRVEFINKVAPPIVNKMFDCGMIP